jgi:hypothetical protein
VQELAAIESLDIGLLAYIDSELMLTTTKNPKVQKEWYVLGIMSGYSPVMQPSYIWIGEQGRNAYIKSIFQALSDVGNCAMANDWFAECKSFYNSYVVGGVSRVLVAGEETDVPAAAPGASAASMIAVTAIPLVTAMVLAVVAFYEVD